MYFECLHKGLKRLQIPYTARKMSSELFGVFGDTLYFPVFSSNAGKCGPDDISIDMS